MFFYNTISKLSQAEYKDKGSTFIAFANHTPNKIIFKQQLQEIQKLHSKATHHCYAYCLGFEPSLMTKSSDDGEPSGSAGKPILNQLLSKKITEASVIVVRYFGGTLLGIPGLTTAYKNAASMALQVAPIEKKNIYQNAVIEFEYSQMNDILQTLKKHECIIIENQIGIFGKIICQIPLSIKQSIDDYFQTDSKHKKIIWQKNESISCE